MLAAGPGLEHGRVERPLCQAFAVARRVPGALRPNVGDRVPDHEIQWGIMGAELSRWIGLGIEDECEALREELVRSDASFARGA